MARHYLPAAAFVLATLSGATPCLAEDTGTDSSTPVVEIMNAEDANPAAGSLYERLGGTAKVTAVVGETIDKIATSPRTRRSFDEVDVKRVKGLLVQQICSLTGGGCMYVGDTLKDVHGGQGLTSAEIYQLVEVLRGTMRNYDIPLSARNELLAILNATKREVAER